MIWVFFGSIVLLWFLALAVFGFGSVIHILLGLRRATVPIGEFASIAAPAPADPGAIESHTPSDAGDLAPAAIQCWPSTKPRTLRSLDSKLHGVG